MRDQFPGTSCRREKERCPHVDVEICTAEIPVLAPPLRTLALTPSPDSGIRQGTQVIPSSDSSQDEDGCDLKTDSRSKERSGEVERDGSQEEGEVEGWEVVVQEKLTLHDEEGEVVKEPAEGEESTDSVVEDDLGCEQKRWAGVSSVQSARFDEWNTRRTVCKVLVSSLSSEYEERSNGDICEHRER